MRYVNDLIIDASNVVADFNSEIVDLNTIVNFSVQIVWASTTAAGTVTVQVSNDDVNWVTLGSAATINNNSGNVIVDRASNPYKSMRVAVDWTSGSITSLKCTYTGKGF